MVKSSLWRWLLVFLCVATIGLGFSLFYSLQHDVIHVDSKDASQTVFLNKGESADTLIQRLQKKHGLKYPLALRLWLRLSGQGERLQVGEYAINNSMTYFSLIQSMVEGKVLTRQLTLVPGWRYAQVQRALNEAPGLKHDTRGLTQLQIAKHLHIAHPKVEGCFYPDTYQYHWPDSDWMILSHANKKMQQVLEQQWAKRATHLMYKRPYQALIVASLIERETARDDERALIAGVILRRLSLNMRLQIDPTVAYGLGRDSAQGLTHTDLASKTPYNTYLNKGLVPTPIALVSTPSLYAALHPVQGSYLYYVSKGDGSHIFTDDYVDHKKAVHLLRLYQSKQKQKANAQSAKEKVSAAEKKQGQAVTKTIKRPALSSPSQDASSSKQHKMESP